MCSILRGARPGGPGEYRQNCVWYLAAGPARGRRQIGTKLCAVSCGRRGPGEQTKVAELCALSCAGPGPAAETDRGDRIGCSILRWARPGGAEK